ASSSARSSGWNGVLAAAKMPRIWARAYALASCLRYFIGTVRSSNSMSIQFAPIRAPSQMPVRHGLDDPGVPPALAVRRVRLQQFAGVGAVLLEEGCKRLRGRAVRLDELL